MLSPARYFVTTLLFMQACYCVASKSALYGATIYSKPDDMPDAEDFDEDDTWEEGLTELDRQRHVSADEDTDLIEDEDDSFVDELDEEE
jgi:hypothetical protein